jgi:tRNA(fMet)-specific endonuclease VapC
MTVADTDVLIDFLEGQGAAQQVAAELSAGRLWTTVISYFELMSGAHDRRRRENIRTLLDALEILPLDREAADDAAVVRRELERTGSGIGMADSLIAGIVLARGGALMTRNQQHFKRVRGLVLAVPSAPFL